MPQPIDQKYKIFFFLTVVFFCYFLTINSHHADYDLWHRMAIGALFFQNGHLPDHDVFAYTPVKEVWIDHEWGTGLIFYQLGQVFGDHGLILFKFGCAIGVLALIFLTQKLSARNRFRYGLFYYILTCLVIWPGFVTTLRAQVFTYFFFSLWIYILERIRRDQYGLIWLLPVTMVVWTNVHGGFVVGLGLVGMYGIGELLNGRRPYRYLGILAVTFLVTFINPYGIDYWHYILEAVTMDRPYILEWEPYNPWGWRPDQIAFILLFMVMTISALFHLAKNRREMDWVKVVIVAVTLFLTLRHTRHLVFWGISVSVFCYDAYIRVMNTLSDQFHAAIIKIVPQRFVSIGDMAGYATVYFLLLAFLLIQTIGMPIRIHVPEHKYPVQGIEFIRLNQLSGDLMLPFRWGGYALWKLYPQCLVSLDSRYEVIYQKETYMDIMRFFRDPAKLDHFQRVLEKYPPDIILVLPQTETYQRLLALSSWAPVYQDPYAAVFLPKKRVRQNYMLPDRQYRESDGKYHHFIP
ncbi:MAG: hypothetical protein ABIK15_18315 [Pseudomonadota bacterium]